jgi:hypothetical protein
MSSAGTVVLSLGVYYDEAVSASPVDLWTREIVTGFLPTPAELFARGATPADAIILCPSQDGPDEGELWPVKRRYWRFDGTVVLELFGMQVDPSPTAGEAMRAARRRSWHTRGNGEPDAVLEAAGWRRDD